ncbi:hypothetical protein PP724_23080, partial [Ralstonia solanacearum]
TGPGWVRFTSAKHRKAGQNSVGVDKLTKDKGVSMRPILKMAFMAAVVGAATFSHTLTAAEMSAKERPRSTEKKEHSHAYKKAKASASRDAIDEGLTGGAHGPYQPMQQTRAGDDPKPRPDPIFGPPEEK